MADITISRLTVENSRVVFDMYVYPDVSNISFNMEACRILGTNSIMFNQIIEIKLSPWQSIPLKLFWDIRKRKDKKTRMKNFRALDY